MNEKIVWSDKNGDLRKDQAKDPQEVVDESGLELKIRRLKSGKGRVVLEITDLPENKKWCKSFAKDLKKTLACGGAYKNSFIEVHTDNIDRLSAHLDRKKIKWKKTGG